MLFASYGSPIEAVEVLIRCLPPTSFVQDWQLIDRFEKDYKESTHRILIILLWMQLSGI
jgi:hypothetical protein